MKTQYSCYLGVYSGVEIITKTERIQARAYASKNNYWQDKYGFWLVNNDPKFSFGVICDYIPYEISNIVLEN